MRRQIPSIISLLCFEAAARTENFAEAAKLINLTQSTLSRHIQNLEKQLQQSLFIRQRQRVKLTRAGHLFLSELSPQLEQLEATMLKARSSPDVSGALNIGVYPTLGSRWLMPILMRLAKERSGLTLNTITYLHNEQIDPDLIDVAIAQGDPPWPGYGADYLMPETLVAIASPALLSEPLARPEDLFDFRVLQHITRPQTWPIWFTSLGKDLKQKPIGPVFSQFEMLIDAVKRGYGIGIVPKILVEDDLAAGTVILAHKHVAEPKSAYYLLVPQAKVGSGRIEKFKKLLLAATEETLPRAS